MASVEYPFNDDLLLRDEDRLLAKRLYPNIYPALDHPELRAVFGERDAASNAAKTRSRRSGFAAVLLVGCALLATSAQPLYEGWPEAAKAIAAVSAAAGIAGAGLGFFGVLFARAKRRWLENRLITERLRQFHFQSLLALWPEILAAAESGDWAAFHSRRAAEFARVQRDVIDRIGSIYDRLVEEEREEHPWLFRRPDQLEPGAHAGELLASYKRLRVDRQLGYAAHKLREDRRTLSSMPRTQARRLDLIAQCSVIGLIALHVVVLPAAFVSDQVIGEETVRALHVGAIWLAIAALALRTIEDGLKPHQEIERYRHYRAAIERVADKFNEPTLEAQLAAAADLERLTVDEMVNFLKSNDEARFVM